MTAHEKTYEMFWDCRYCGQRKNLGLSHRHCPGCGAPQDPGARYFPSDAEKVAVEDHPYVGVDVRCPSCTFANSRNNRCCASCGGPLGQGQAVMLHQDPRGAPYVGGVAAAPPPATKKKPFPLAFVLVPIALLVTCFAGCMFVAFKTRPGELSVTARSWERSIEIDRNELARDSSWCDGVPAGARVVSRQKAQRGTTKIPDGETCSTRRQDQGNGTFKEVRDCRPKYTEKPSYDDRCDYEVPRWRTVRTERAQGTTEAPRWPDAKLGSPGACLGCEREGKRTESYKLTLREAKTGEDGTCEVPEGVWATYAVGQTCKAAVGSVLGNIDCKSIAKR